MNESNLKPIRSESEARELGKRGGLASGQSRREKKALKELLEAVMEQDHYQLDGTKTTKGMAMALRMVDKAIDGDVAAFRAIKETLEPSLHRWQIERPGPEVYAEMDRLLGIGDDHDENSAA